MGYGDHGSDADRVLDVEGFARRTDAELLKVWNGDFYPREGVFAAGCILWNRMGGGKLIALTADKPYAEVSGPQVLDSSEG